MFLNKEQAKALKVIIDYNTGAKDFTFPKDAKQLKEALLLLEKKVNNK
jgi:hypothetical protein